MDPPPVVGQNLHKLSGFQLRLRHVGMELDKSNAGEPGIQDDGVAIEAQRSRPRLLEEGGGAVCKRDFHAAWAQMPGDTRPTQSKCFRPSGVRGSPCALM